ncbi:MAG: YqaA family protein [Verrucomicrobiota bacterium]
MTHLPRKPHVLRRLYNWTLSWADTKYGLWALIGLSFIESSFFPIPPDVLLIALCFSKPKKWATYAFWCSVASVLGGMLGWWIGKELWTLVGHYFFSYLGAVGFTTENFDKVQAMYQQYGFVAVLAAAFTPIPYKIFTIASGVFNFSFWGLVLASALGRSARFFLVAGFIRVGGPKIKPALEKNFEWAISIAFALGVLGFLAIKWIK